MHASVIPYGVSAVFNSLMFWIISILAALAFVQSFVPLHLSPPSSYSLNAISPYLKSRKLDIVLKTKQIVDAAKFIIVFDIKGVRKVDIDQLRNDLPQQTIALVAKNSLLKRAVDSTSLAEVSSICNGQNMFVFVNEGDSKKCIDTLWKWFLGLGRMEPLKCIKGCSVENRLFAPNESRSILECPSKHEILGLLLQKLTMIPTAVATSMKHALASKHDIDA